MTKVLKYKNARDFRTALEARLKTDAAKNQIDLGYLRKLVAFERTLARLFQKPKPKWYLKGGYTMELRFDVARTTMDIDLGAMGKFPTEPDLIQEALSRELKIDMDDYFEFLIKPAKLEIQNSPYGGFRFPIEAKLDGRLFDRFSLDIGIGDVVVFEPVEQELPNQFTFVGLKSTVVKMISLEQHIAEKLHAYTLPRGEIENSRVKDLVDLYLIFKLGKIEKPEARKAIEMVFSRRGTHVPPKKLVPPPDSWSAMFDRLTEDVGITIPISDAFKLVHKNYLDIVY